MEPNTMPPQTETRVTPVVVPPPPTKTSYGALFGILIIALAIAAGAYYFFTLRVDELVAITESQQATIAALDAQSSSTEPEAIQEDLDAQSPDDFDAEMEEAFIALEAAFNETE